MPAVVVLRGNTWSLLKDDSTRGSAGRSTGLTRSALVVVETALRAHAARWRGPAAQELHAAAERDPGFATDHVLTAQMSLPPARYADAAARRAFWTRLVDAARALPGVTTVGLTTNVPFNGSVCSGSYSIVGYTPGPTEAQPHGRQEVVGGDYFAAMQIPLIEGRFFNDGDTADSPPVVVIDQYLADRYFANRSALGQQIQRGGPDSPRMTIVGVAGTINSIDLGQPVDERARLSSGDAAAASGPWPSC